LPPVTPDWEAAWYFDLRTYTVLLVPAPYPASEALTRSEIPVITLFKSERPEKWTMPTKL